MGSWNFSNVGVVFDKSKYSDALIEHTMKCLGYSESNFMRDPDFFQTGVTGPEFSDSYTGGWTYANDGYVPDEDLFYLLNFIFEKVGVYVVYAKGNTVSDHFTGEEITFDAIEKKKKTINFDYCYGDGTAFGEEIETDDLDDLISAGTRCDELPISPDYTIENIDAYLSDIISTGTERGYTEVVELVRNRCKENNIILTDNPFSPQALYDYLEEADGPVELGVLASLEQWNGKTTRRQIEHVLRRFVSEGEVYRSHKEGKEYYSVNSEDSDDSEQSDIADLLSFLTNPAIFGSDDNNEENDEEIDLDSLMHQLDELGDSVNALAQECGISLNEPEMLSYSNGQVVSTDSFEIEIPDGYKLELDVENTVTGNSLREFVLWKPMFDDCEDDGDWEQNCTIALLDANTDYAGVRASEIADKMLATLSIMDAILGTKTSSIEYVSDSDNELNGVLILQLSEDGGNFQCFIDNGKHTHQFRVLFNNNGIGSMSEETVEYFEKATKTLFDHIRFRR